MENKKILIITYYWPPAGGPGVQRWLKFVKYLPEFGWKPTIFIPENPNYPIVDETLKSEVADDLEIIRNRIWEPYQIAEFFGKENKKFKAGQFDVGTNQSWKSKLSVWVRGNFFIPDARVFWVKPSARLLKAYLKENHFDAIVTTGPPHSVHLIGLKLKKEFPDLKWIADFRDPWTEISYYKHLKLTKSADLKHRTLEQQVFKTADITLATSFSDSENFAEKGANAVCITNGFDEVESVTYEKSTKFTLSYVGVLEQLRNPDILWEVLNGILFENPAFSDDFEFKCVGRIDDKILRKINSSPLKNSLRNLGYLSHAEANREMRNSDLLLITNFPDEASKGIIPGKIFEYLATGNQILSFGPKDSDVKIILAETNAGQHFTYDDAAALKVFILQQYENWKSGNLQQETRNIDRFSRKYLTGKLTEILDREPA
ncbi:TPR/glycosyl transferase domain protein [Flavobacteriaceae bacterium 3519-10]|nr:TPR/glycosyl transferase domain protein [Flavobacteriaceae bacterium 3519-10]